MAEPATLDTPAVSSSQTPTVVSQQAPGSVISSTGKLPPSTRKIDSSSQESVEPSLDSDKPDDKILSLDDPDKVFDLEDQVITKPDSTKSNAKDTSKSKSTDVVVDKPNEGKLKVEIKAKEEADGFDLGLEVKTDDNTQNKGKRDYSGLKQEYVDILKHVPNYLYEKARDVLKNLDQITQERDKIKQDYEAIKSGKLPDNYYEHERAYLLHPDYEQATRTQELINFEDQHYRQQLRLIKQGQSWIEIKGYKKDGEPVIVKHEGSKDNIDAEMAVTDFIANLRAKSLETSSKLGEITNNFKSQHEKTLGTLEQIDNKYFSKMKDISIFPKEAQDYYNQVVSWFQQNAPTLNPRIVQMFAKSALSNVYKTQELDKMTKLVKQLSEKKEDIREAGPTSKDLSGAGVAKGEVMYDTKDLDKDW